MFNIFFETTCDATTEMFQHTENKFVCYGNVLKFQDPETDLMSRADPQQGPESRACSAMEAVQRMRDVQKSHRMIKINRI